MPRIRCVRPLCLALAALALPPAGFAQEDPWIGRWASPRCGADATEIVLGRRTLDLSTFETVCTVRRAGRRGDVYELDTGCRGEGGSSRATFSVRVDGDVLTFVGQKGFAFDPKRFVRCPGRR